MKFKGRLIDHVMLANGEQRLTIQTRDDLRGLYDQLHNDEVSTDVKKYRKHRSLDANAYFHVLANRIAVALGSSDEEVKKRLVVKYGAVETDGDGSPCGAMFPASADIDRFYPYARRYKTVEQNGRTYDCYLFYKRTRDLDSRELSRLIDGAVSEAKALGIETVPPEELKALEALWKNNQGGCNHVQQQREDG